MDWKCIDPVLCTYRLRTNGEPYQAQRTVWDMLAIWHKGEKIGTASNFDAADEIVARHMSQISRRSAALDELGKLDGELLEAGGR